MKNKRGFTLIELMIVIAIMGFLFGIILISINVARSNAAVAKTKEVFSSLKNAVMICCTDARANTLLTVIGGDVCNPSISSLLPGGSQLGGDVTVGSVSVLNACNAANPAIRYNITAHPKSECIGNWDISATKITPPAGC